MKTQRIASLVLIFMAWVATAHGQSDPVYHLTANDYIDVGFLGGSGQPLINANRFVDGINQANHTLNVNALGIPPLSGNAGSVLGNNGTALIWQGGGASVAAGNITAGTLISGVLATNSTVAANGNIVTGAMLTGYAQPLNANLTSLASVAPNLTTVAANINLYALLASPTFTGTPLAPNATVTDTAQVATLHDILNFAGSGNIATVGTVTGGTWNAGIVAGTYGGTGVNNGARLLTYAGNVTFAGGNRTTFTTSVDNGNIVLPAVNSTLAYTKRTTVSDADYNAVSTDRYIAYTTLTANRTLNLPAASTVTAGATWVIVDESGNASNTTRIAVQANGTDNVSGGTGVGIWSPRGVTVIHSNGVDGWLVEQEASFSGNRIAIGDGSFAGTNSTAIGRFSLASGNLSVAMGKSANATTDNSVAIGGQSSASGNLSVAIGQGANAAGSSIAIGQSANVSSGPSIGIGLGVNVSTAISVGIGWLSNATGATSVVVGGLSTANSTNAIAIGEAANALSGNSIAIGKGALTGNVAVTDATGAIAIGANATASPTTGIGGGQETAVGDHAKSLSWRTSSYGGYSTAVVVSSSAYGWGSFAFGAHSAAFGRSAFSLVANTQTASGGGVRDIYWNNGYAAIYTDSFNLVPGTNPVDNDVGQSVTMHGVDGRDISALVYFSDNQTTPTGNGAIGWLTINATGVATAYTPIDVGGGYVSGHIVANPLCGGTLPTFTYTLSSGAIVSATVSGGSGLNPTTNNNIGGDYNIAPGKGTGTAIGGNFNVQVTPAGNTSNNLVNTAYNALTVAPSSNISLPGIVTVNGTLTVASTATFSGNILVGNTINVTNGLNFGTDVIGANSSRLFAQKWQSPNATTLTIANGSSQSIVDFNDDKSVTFSAVVSATGNITGGNLASNGTLMTAAGKKWDVKDYDGVSSVGVTIEGTDYGLAAVVTSDARLKSNLRPPESALAKFEALNVYLGDYREDYISMYPKTDKAKFHDRTMLLAQDVQKYFPKSVLAAKDGHLTIDYMSLIPEMILSVKELDAKVNSLTVRNNLLAGQVSLSTAPAPQGSPDGIALLIVGTGAAAAAAAKRKIKPKI